MILFHYVVLKKIMYACFGLIEDVTEGEKNTRGGGGGGGGGFI